MKCFLSCKNLADECLDYHVSAVFWRRFPMSNFLGYISSDGSGKEGDIACVGRESSDSLPPDIPRFSSALRFAFQENK